jgi:hypothetical protein
MVRPDFLTYEKESNKYKNRKIYTHILQIINKCMGLKYSIIISIIKKKYYLKPDSDN